jgi:hypothetical protein
MSRGLKLAELCAQAGRQAARPVHATTLHVWRELVNEKRKAAREALSAHAPAAALGLSVAALNGRAPATQWTVADMAFELDDLAAALTSLVNDGRVYTPYHMQMRFTSDLDGLREFLERDDQDPHFTRRAW